MKPTKYPGNGRGLYVEHVRSREGPKSYFNILYKGSARSVRTPIELSRVLGCARYTDASKELRKWAEEHHSKIMEEMEKKAMDERHKERVEREGFGPEAHETPPEDPTTHTKMIT